MTEDQIAIVQRTFKQVAPISDVAGPLFYNRLFRIAPEVESLFTGDVEEQGRKLIATLAVVVNGLRDLDAILPAARTLAIRHAGYGVRPEHYGPVGEALLWTLGEGLGEAFDADARAAWAAAYDTLSATMIAAAHPGGDAIAAAAE